MATKLDRDELIEDLQRVADVIGERPTASQYREHGHYDSVNAFRREFGSWAAGLEAAGFDSRGQVADPSKEAERIEVECAFCGEQREVRKSQNNDQERWYCSRDCHNQWMAENKFGENHPQYNRVTVECTYCGSGFERKRWFKENYDRHFCPDDDCYSKWCSDERSGEKHPRWSEYPEVECEHCGEPYKVKPALEDTSRFCSNLCKYEGRNITGENNGNWQGGYQPYYGSNWREQRRKRLELDGYECVVCGMTQEEHMEEYATGLHVHHIIPHREFRKGDDLDAEAANDLDNLRSMCIKHHRKWEGVPVAPDHGN